VVNIDGHLDKKSSTLWEQISKASDFDRVDRLAMDAGVQSGELVPRRNSHAHSCVQQLQNDERQPTRGGRITNPMQV
jgi:hypothetical protein